MTTFNFPHLNATPEDLEGNKGIGRYLLLPGSDGRAQEIAEHFENRQVKKHPRGHHLYTGTINVESISIDIATVATGMGSASMEIFMHELYHLGAKRFLRIGTAGSLQPWAKTGNLINVQASVRDEDTTQRYVPREFPAIASLELTTAILLAAEQLDFLEGLHTGIVHSKSSLYAREFGEGPQSEENKRYMDVLIKAGVVASEMETSALFIQAQLYNREVQIKMNSPDNQVLAGAILAVVATLEEGLDTSERAKIAIKNSIELGLETVKILALQELVD